MLYKSDLRDFNWRVDRSGKAYYLQLAAFLKSRIQSGDIPVGYIFPSLRHMEKIFGISRNVIFQALDRLASENFLEITPNHPITVKDTGGHTVHWGRYLCRGSHMNFKSNVAAIMRRRKSQGRLHGINYEQVEADFGYVSLYRKTLNTIRSERRSDEQVEKDLLKAVGRRLSRIGIHVDAPQMLITPNDNIALYLLSVPFFQRNTTLLTSKPGRLSLTSAMESRGTEINYISIDNGGMVVDDLYTKIKNSPRPILYIEPLASPPARTVMNNTRLLEILELCRNTQTPVIEGDYLRDQWLEVDYPPMKSYDASGNLIYLTNLAGVFSPMDSLSVITGSPALMEQLRNFHRQMGIRCPALTQAVLLTMLQNDSYDRYVAHFRFRLKKRYLLVIALLEKYLSQTAEWSRPAGGIYLLLLFKSPVRLTRMKIRTDLCAWSPGIHYGEEFKNAIMIAVTSCSMENLEVFIETLGREAERQLY